ncbi:hypothetical protein SOASR030_26530 [Leminorella grimontii]|uniref:DUF2251 domain-containing protein n=1 Tax=Leminorella grimontii TaxID=82981 RepID=A0AAV5N391_9GAMM|nr:DUF2251 domain-containing protein [Leminorella grimontii]KFC94798.1 hypothetical protein GLGR_2559 [Leminorella grimontii ATCC 33999 = DSM 5078]GKX56541.1 hypothetical protein SOASR030_26530 [Leminorella grimontii]GKX59859.1 hypothetical protein SOASR031_21740 [Leminorella grimontii]VFS61595.1 Uncharacterized protein conserved in bacteria [Leminorella grimontii]
MAIYVTAQDELIVGNELVVESEAPEGAFAAVFEDDGQTGYFYALDHSIEGNPIQDAVHIYNVEDVTDGDKPSDVQIGWSEDGRKCVLLINGYPHGAFNFESQRGYCRTGFPDAFGEWSKEGHQWDDDAVERFFATPH